MTMTDPIADMLTRIRNALKAMHDEVSVPSSKMKVAVAKILKEEGYIKDYKVIQDNKQGILKIALKWGSHGEKVITGLKKVSKPGRRVYCGKEDIPVVIGGLGITILSTSRGILTGAQAKKMDIGGEVICNIW
ncbi:MAG: 30S ribosomal protein S8 [Candidatus Aminicenantes bacterium]|nr:30S ribosomal protein S8 [Candidatus Aminicenantes bacterium]MDH5714267.1 30S ribosomal protein S8 [Candidatus Aminicenantes bacterium]